MIRVKFMELDGINERKILLNVCHIVSIQPSGNDKDLPKDCCVINMAGASGAFIAQDKYEDILAVLERL